ncbi:biotin/lipoyl-containing protein [Chitinilyticum piscinae]|uniref:Lipoyl-binding domain-containing protein n=1 Tax=Chitinilyticum piscinae TaxID=2866724 RepID=A0A8J7K9K3_9NEIS|nr:biotin/lipoyl-containing protein [Chitinilyticum piscinae]MBE9608269.1 hypothetical protein [Chitinilyticum piscinae]
MDAYTTHLICAPELTEPALVLRINASSGEAVAADTPLVHLLCAGEELRVAAPDDGVLGQVMVRVGDAVHGGDLLLMMEIIEESTQLYPLQEEEAVFAPACQLPPRSSVPGALATDELRVTRAAATLAARMGVDLGLVAAPGVLIDEAAVFAFVRQQLQG